jgi:hypothetical protein
MQVEEKLKFYQIFFKCLIFVSAIIVNSSCSVRYSTSGASISPDVKTVSIQYFQNRAPIVYPPLSQNFTDELKDKFMSSTALKVVSGNGDLSFEGEITDFSTKPMDINQNDVASQNRLTISVKVKFVNSKDQTGKSDFEKTFSRFEDYSSTQTLSDVESDLSAKIIEQLILDIFNQAVVNW